MFRGSAASPTKLKLAVTDLLPDLKALQQIEFTFDGNTDDLLRYVDREIELHESRIAVSNGPRLLSARSGRSTLKRNVEALMAQGDVVWNSVSTRYERDEGDCLPGPR